MIATRRPDGTYQVDYNHSAYKKSEPRPTQLAFDALMAAFQRGV